jgi:3-oxoacyl-[acyl-carrier protein] reductase
MNLNLKNKKVIITGATRGIGAAIAELMAEEGAHVGLCARNDQQVAHTVAKLRDKGVQAFGAAVDIGDHSALVAWVHNSAEALGGIDMVIANPSAFGVGAAEEDWLNGFAVDLMGSVHTIDAAMSYLEQSAAVHGDASVLIMSSAAVAETDFESAYGAYKAALIHYAKGAARRLAPKGIRVNTISPGTIYVDDGFWGNAKRHLPQLYESFFNRNPMGRMGEAKEVANVAAFLCSPLASFVSGANVTVDGAWTGRVNY